MKRISTVVLAFAFFAVACGSDVNVATVQPASEPTATPEPSTADPILGGGPYPIGTIDFVVSNRQTNEVTATYAVSCLGDTATLTGDWSPTETDEIGAVAADLMCRQLNESDVQDRLINGVPADQICTEIYGSADFADVTGELGGQPVSTTFDRANGCGIDDWDGLMAGLLPLPIN